MMLQMSQWINRYYFRSPHSGLGTALGTLRTPAHLRSTADRHCYSHFTGEEARDPRS